DVGFIDAAGNITVAGITQSTIDFGGGPIVGPPGGPPSHLGPLDPLGAVGWNKVFTPRRGRAHPPGGALPGDAHPSGDIFLGGSFYCTYDFGGGPVTPPSTITNDYIVRLDTSGALISVRTYANGPVFALGRFGAIGPVVGGGQFFSTFDLGA